ncbi:MAG: hypothetical protein IT205_05815 [Fimbriimonadaceae bacterium]|nr:hypothetical protein [Fimbriimonadaceae bacterium]
MSFLTPVTPGKATVTSASFVLRGLQAITTPTPNLGCWTRSPTLNGGIHAGPFGWAGSVKVTA